MFIGAEESTFSKPCGWSTWAGEAHIAPYGLFDSACFLSKSTSFFVLANFWAPCKPPCLQIKCFCQWETLKELYPVNGKLTQQPHTGMTIKSNCISVASSNIISAIRLNLWRGVTICNFSSTDATITFAPALRNTSIKLKASISSDPLATGTRT